MNQIELINHQNISINYSLASVWDRIIAFIIDLIILSVFTFFWFLIISGIFSINNEGLALLIYLILICCYTLIFESLLNGKTPGKYLLKIQVITLHGERPDTSSLFIRWVMRLADIYFSLGSLGILSINGSPKGQRLGDLMANTVVVKIKPATVFSLSELLKLQGKISRKVTYPEVIKLDEHQVIFIKNVINRRDKYPNDAHNKAVKKLRRKIESILDLKTGPKKQDKELLRTILKDYVFLSR